MTSLEVMARGAESRPKASGRRERKMVENGSRKESR